MSGDDNVELIIEQDIQQAKVTFTEAVKSINILMKLYEENDEANQVTNLINMRTKTVQSFPTKKKTDKS